MIPDIRPRPVLCAKYSCTGCCSSCDNQRSQVDASAWLLFTNRLVCDCLLLIPLSRAFSLSGSGTSHTSSSPGSSPMSSLSKKRFRDSESCAIKLSYYFCFKVEPTVFIEHWNSLFSQENIVFFCWLNIIALNYEKNLWSPELHRFGGFRTSEISILSASYLPYMLMNSLICKAGLLINSLD